MRQALVAKFRGYANQKHGMGPDTDAGYAQAFETCANDLFRAQPGDEAQLLAHWERRLAQAQRDRENAERDYNQSWEQESLGYGMAHVRCIRELGEAMKKETLDAT